jgi:hypothetical protein
MHASYLTRRLATASFSLVLILGAVTPSLSASSVRVKGYIRKDGTYVAPHYRSSPDSSKYNNWSSKGNSNPYSGKTGSKDPYSYGGSYVSPRYVPAPIYTPPATTSPTYTYTPPTTSVSNDNDELRKSEASDLKKLGVDVDWQKHTFLELYNMKNRAKMANDLKKYGLSVDWQKHTFLEMYDWENRIKIANDLKGLGLDVDWQKHTFLEMYDWENRIKMANDLTKVGIHVNWRDHSWMEMYKMEQDKEK